MVALGPPSTHMRDVLIFAPFPPNIHTLYVFFEGYISNCRAGITRSLFLVGHREILDINVPQFFP